MIDPRGNFVIQDADARVLTGRKKLKPDVLLLRCYRNCEPGKSTGGVDSTHPDWMLHRSKFAIVLCLHVCLYLEK